MRLATARAGLALRELALDDWRAMAAIEGDDETVRWQSFAPRSEAECRAYLARAEATARDPERACFDLAVELDGRMVGRLGLDVKLPERRVGELWFVLERALWGQALMPTAAHALGSWGLTSLGLTRLFLECDPRNRGAIRLAEKLRMTREAHLRRHTFLKGEWCDSLIFGLLAPEWGDGLAF